MSTDRNKMLAALRAALMRALRAELIAFHLEAGVSASHLFPGSQKSTTKVVPSITFTVPRRQWTSVGTT